MLVGDPVVRHANDADLDEVVAGGTAVSVTVGANAPDGDGDPIVHVVEALAEPAEFATVTTKRCVPIASPLYPCGDEHAVGVPPSIEQLTLVGEPVVTHAKDAAVDVVDAAGADVSATVGADAEAVAIVHVYVAVAAPAALETVTANRWLPDPRPAYVRGEAHAAVAPSSEHTTPVGAPVAVHAKEADVELVVAAGADVIETVGSDGPGGGGGGEPESRSVPKSCVQ